MATWFSDRYFNEWYDYLNPVNYFRTMYHNFKDDGYNFGDLSLGLLGVDTVGDYPAAAQNNGEQAEKVANSTEILGHVANNATKDFLSDRAHTEMREDTAYQRSVEDMRKAGLNPYTIGAAPAASSASQVGAASIASKVQVLGYLLDLKNLDATNRKITNSTLTNLLGSFSKMS